MGWPLNIDLPLGNYEAFCLAELFLIRSTTSSCHGNKSLKKSLAQISNFHNCLNSEMCEYSYLQFKMSAVRAIFPSYLIMSTHISNWPMTVRCRKANFLRANFPVTVSAMVVLAVNDIGTSFPDHPEGAGEPSSLKKVPLTKQLIRLSAYLKHYHRRVETAWKKR